MAKLLRERKAWAKIEILKAIERLSMKASTTKDCRSVEMLARAYADLSGFHLLREPKGEPWSRVEQGSKGEDGAEYVAKLRGPTIPGVKR